MRLKRLAALWRTAREPLPSLFDRHPDALAGSRHPRGLQAVPLEAIVGTARHPSQNTADFLPLPQLRGSNWESRWQRIQEATKRLAILPAVDLLKVGDEYWVVDGHNRIAAALRDGAAAIDADVTELLVPGTTAERHLGASQMSMLGSEELRQAGEGRFSPTAPLRSAEPSRDELARIAEELEAADEGEARHATAEGHETDEPPGGQPT
ncbi:MAG: hypothetical protein M3P14_06070 [Chloroflexota bacterium]|nr:hypothetical protein [Chloroflexota bacterium]